MATYQHTVIPGTTGVFQHPIGFPYNRVADVRVYVDRVLRNQGSGASDYLFANSGDDILFTTPNEPQTGETLLISRVTDLSTASILYTSGSGVTQRDLNRAVEQLRFAIDELQVPAFDTGAVSLTPVLAASVPYLHNLGVQPTRLEVTFECTGSNLGYLVGHHLQSSSFIIPLVVVADSTTIFVQKANSAILSLPHALTGVETEINDTKWNYHIRAWR